MLIWAAALGIRSHSLLLTLALASRTGAVSMRAGMTIGAGVTFLSGTLIEPLLESVAGAIAGGALAVVLGKIQQPPLDQSHAR